SQVAAEWDIGLYLSLQWKSLVREARAGSDAAVLRPRQSLFGTLGGQSSLDFLPVLVDLAVAQDRGRVVRDPCDQRLLLRAQLAVQHDVHRAAEVGEGGVGIRVAVGDRQRLLAQLGIAPQRMAEDGPGPRAVLRVVAVPPRHPRAVRSGQGVQ